MDIKDIEDSLLENLIHFSNQWDFIMTPRSLESLPELRSRNRTLDITVLSTLPVETVDRSAKSQCGGLQTSQEFSLGFTTLALLHFRERKAAARTLKEIATATELRKKLSLVSPPTQSS